MYVSYIYIFVLLIDLFHVQGCQYLCQFSWNIIKINLNSTVTVTNVPHYFISLSERSTLKIIN
jgi:hypothetical protein